MTLVAGIDSSTQSCKVVIRDAESGRLVRHGAAPHPEGTEVDPEAWWLALQRAIDAAGGLSDVAAAAIAGQQHGMVALDHRGQVIRPALLWNDLRSAAAAVTLTTELGDGDSQHGAQRWAQETGLVPTASFTVTKLRWLADHEPDTVRKVAAIALPHDWLTWRLSGSDTIADLVTDRSDASGTGYFDSVTGEYRRDLIARAFRDEQLARDLVLPRVAAPHETVGHGSATLGYEHLTLGPGLGDNAGAALALGLGFGDTMVSLGTSGVVGTIAPHRANDPTGLVAGFADGTGHFLHLAVTLNAARIIDATARLLDTDYAGFDELAAAAQPGAGGLVYVPYLEGERAPNLPDATGMLQGMTLASLSRENMARATVEGMLCHLANAMDALRAQQVDIAGVSLVGGAARSQAVCHSAPAIFQVPVTVPAPSEYVADGAARQAAWVLSGAAQPPQWPQTDGAIHTAPPASEIIDAYRIAACDAATVAMRENQK